MSLLKSAWEIAMEKTEGIQADPQKIKHDALVNDGRRLAGSYLLDIEADGSEVEKVFKNATGEDKKLLKQGMATTILLNVALPQSADYGERIKKMQWLAQLIDGKKSESSKLLDQIEQFMGKYMHARDTLLERAKQQYQMVFEEKQERMMQKYGKRSASMEQDPEFIQLLQNSYSQLSSQYQQALDQIKNQLRGLWGLEDL